jgi:hypothetical protein
MENTHGQTEILMRASLPKAHEKGRGSLERKMETYMKASLKKI